MRETFSSSGRVGHDLAAVDWARTPLGPPEGWPRSLQAVVRLVLSSRYSMWMAWGPELTFFCNDAYRRDTLGAKYPWALGRPSAEVWSEIWPDVGPRIERVLSTGVATWDEELLLFLERSGYREETYHTFSYSPVTDDSGAIAGMLCVVKEDTEEVISRRRMGVLRDVAARTTAQLTEEETVAAFSRVLSDSTLDAPFHLVYLEAGHDRYRLVGKAGFREPHPAAPAVLSPGTDDAPWPAPAAVGALPVIVDGIDRRFWQLPTGGWSTPPTQAALVPIRGAHGLPYGFLVIGLNAFRPFDDGYADFLGLLSGQLGAAISDARAYELERERAESLLRLDQAKTDFFTNISHEFRTPLTLLLGPVEDALSDVSEPLPPGHRNRLEVVQRNGLRLLKLVNGLLDFSRLESGRADASFEPVDLGTTTRELAGMFGSAAERLGLTLEVDCPASLEPVHVDPELWSKLVLNLLSNALKFTFEGRVTVRLAHEEGAAVLTVQDTGVGIPAEELPHLFERFHRVRHVRSRTHEGSGIGLALVAEVAELHGGSATVTSEVGVGSTFVVRVPLGTAHLPPDRVVERTDRGIAAQVVDGYVGESLQLAAAQAEPVAPPPTRDEGWSADRPRVLVVDDNADVRQYVVSLLADRYDVSTAEDGTAGLELARAERPDLVLTDVMMPRLDGFGLLAALRSEAETMGIPVVMLSARGGETATSEGLEAGADDYLVKPFTARELRARVHANLELDRARRTREELERSRVLMDQAQRLARVGSWSVDLSSGRVRASDELLRILERESGDLEVGPESTFLEAFAHEDDRELARMLVSSARPGEEIGFELRMQRPDGTELMASVHGVVRLTPAGTVEVQGSLQDITAARRTAQSLALAHVTSEVAAREHQIADELQRNLLPQERFDLPDIEVATYYRAGVAGTQVGGDWFDVVQLAGGRTAFVVGDVMGRGVRAAAVMGQVRSAMRAYARLDLGPADLMTALDGLVCDLFPDQIVTCVYAVFDPATRVVTVANAGHVPPLVVRPDGPGRRLTEEPQPPLGLGRLRASAASAPLGPQDVLLLYTDGLVERRDRDPETGIAVLLREASAHAAGTLEELPDALVQACLPGGPDDDVAVLVARVRA